MKLEFERQDIIEIIKREAEKLLPQTPGYHVEVGYSGNYSSAIAYLVKDDDEESKE